VAQRYTFLVPDEDNARGLADAFAELGFPLIMAGPYRPGRYFTDPDAGVSDWDVTVFDGEPDAASEQSDREWQAVKQAARALAQRFGGFLRTSVAFAAGQASLMADTRNAALVQRRPGARPSVPVAPLPAALSPALLPFEVVEPRGDGIDLDGLYDVRWSELSHAHGSAGDVPGLIEALAEGFGDWSESMSELIGDDILHQGSCYSATGPAMLFLARLISSDALPFHQRLDVYEALLSAATRHPASLIADAERAAARGRAPKPAAWSVEVREAIGTCVPSLLERWEVESEPARVELAAFAALYPEHGVAVAEQVQAMAERYPNTDVSALLGLDLALICGDLESAERQARNLAAHHSSADALEAPGLSITNRVAELLARAASAAARRQRAKVRGQ
jgi:hypothetical protein